MRSVTLVELLTLLGTREEIEHVIEGLIEALDDIDGEADREPSLGSIGGTADDRRLDQTGWAIGGSNDAEFDVVDAVCEA